MNQVNPLRLMKAGPESRGAAHQRQLMSRRMVLIPVEGEARLVEVGPDMNTIKDLIGADWIERVRVGDSWSLAVDDSGLVIGKPVNPRASVLYGIKWHGASIRGDVLLGREGFVADGVDWLDSDEAALAWLSETLEIRERGAV